MDMLDAFLDSDRSWDEFRVPSAPSFQLPSTPSFKPPADRGGTDYDDIILAASERHGVDPAYIKAKIRTESNFNPNAVSPVGAKGLMQIMDATGKDLGITDPFDPDQSIDKGTEYFAGLFKKYDGDTRKASAAYNAGSRNIDKAVKRYGDKWLENLHKVTGTNKKTGKPHAEETRKYVKKISKYYDEYKKAAPGKRADGTEKGKGYFGELPTSDGKGYSTEISIGVEFDGKETEIPLLVPTLDQAEIEYLLSGNKPSEEITQKAVDHAKTRISKGLSPFAQDGEQAPGGQADPLDAFLDSDRPWNEFQQGGQGGVTGTWEEEHGSFGELGAGLGRGALRVVGTPASLADIAGEAVGWEGLEKAGEAGAEKIEQYIEKSPRLRKSKSISGDIRDNPQLWTDPRWYLSLIGEGAPTVASMIIPGMAAAKVAKGAGMGLKAIQAARVSGALTAGMGLEAGGAAEDVRQHEKRTGEQVPIGNKLKAVIGTGVVAGSLEAVPIFNLFGSVVARRLIGRIITSMVLEGGTEGAQEIVANAFAKAGYETDRDMVGGVIESVVGGVLLGGGMGAMQGTFQERIKETNPDEVADVLEQAEAEITEITTPSVDEIRAKFESGDHTAEDLEAIKEIWSDDAELSSSIDEILKSKAKPAKPAAPTGAVYKAQKKRQEKLDKEFAQYEKDFARAKQEMADQDKFDEIRLSSEQRQKLIEDEFKSEIEAQKQTERVEDEIDRLKAREIERKEEVEKRKKQIIPQPKPVPEVAKPEKPAAEIKTGEAVDRRIREGGRIGTERRRQERRDVATRKLIDKLSPEEKEFAIPELRRMLKTQKKAALRQERIADSDPLTGLKNRRGLRKETAKREKKGRETVHTFIDLVGFKGLNDYISHEAGDETLKFIAKAMKSVGLENPTRWGGDELMFQAESLEAGDADAQKLHDYFEKNPLRLRDKEGKEYDLTIMFRHGTAKNIEKADEIAEAAKEGEPPEWKRGKAHPGLKEISEKPEKAPEVVEGEKLKRPKIEIGNKFYVAANKANIEITKDYGKGTPTKDYPGMYRMDMSGWVEVKDLETGDKFPITRNELVEIGIEKFAKPTPAPEKTDIALEGEGVEKPAKKPKVSTKGKNIRTLRGFVNAVMGGINPLNFKGEIKDLPLASKYLFKKRGVPIDDAVGQLKDDGWLDKDDTVATFLEKLRIDKKMVSRDRLGEDVFEKKESELTEEEKRFKEEMEREPEEPPKGKYETITVDDLKDGSTYTIIEGRTKDGWDEYKIHKTKEGVTLEDGEIIELEPWDKVQVLKEDLTKWEKLDIKEPMKAPKGPGDITTKQASESPMGGNPFEDSVVQDVVYHATAKDFEVFDPSLAGSSGLPRPGKTKVTFFSASLEEAKEYLKSVFDVSEYYKDVEAYEEKAKRLGIKISDAQTDKYWARLKDLKESGLGIKKSKAVANKEFGILEHDVQLLKEYRRKTRTQPAKSIPATKKRRIVKAYINLKNPIIYDVKGRVTTNRETVRNLYKQAMRDGNDGLILKNVRSFSPEDEPVDHYVTFFPDQIKIIPKPSRPPGKGGLDKSFDQVKESLDLFGKKKPGQIELWSIPKPEAEKKTRAKRKTKPPSREAQLDLFTGKQDQPIQTRLFQDFVRGGKKAVEKAPGEVYEPETSTVQDAGQWVRTSPTGRIFETPSLVAKNASEIASLLSSIGQQARESAYTVTVDKDNNILEVFEHSKGTKSGSLAHPVEVAGHILNIPKADKVYFVHNHPSGDTFASNEDTTTAESLGNILSLKNIEIESFVIGKDKWRPVQYLSVPDEKIKPVTGKERVEVVESILTEGEPGRMVQNSDDFRKILKDKYGGKEGILFFDTKLRELGFMPWPAGESIKKASAQIIAASESVNASGYAIALNKPITYKNRAEFIRNFATNLNRYNLQLFEVLEQGKSYADTGILRTLTRHPTRKFDRLLSEEPLYSTTKTEAKTTADKVFKTILPYLQGMTNFPTVRVVHSDNLSKRLKSQITAYSKKVNKQVEGFYDKVTDTVYLLYNNLSEGRIEAVLRHEAEGHRGIRLLLGSDLDGFLDGVAEAKKKDLKRHDPDLNFKDQDAVRVAADEWVARKIEAGNLGKSFWDDLVRIFRKWLRKIVPNLDLTDSEIRSVLVDTVRNVREGRTDRIKTPEGKPIFSSIADQWHSQMTRFVSDKLPGKSSPAQFKQMLSAWAKKGLIKQEELDWSGLNEWLDSQEGRVTKQQVLDFLAKNNVQIQEVVKGDKRVADFTSSEHAELNKLLKDVDYLGHDYVNEAKSAIMEHEDWASRWDVEDQIRLIELGNKLHEKRKEASLAETKFGPGTHPLLSLPGGKAYKELLLTMPITKGDQKALEKEFDKKYGKDWRPQELTEEEWQRYEASRYDIQRMKKKQYKSSHWEEPNVLAHIRFDERIGPSGEKILHIAEIQSDRHQTGRKQGYMGETKPRLWEKFKRQIFEEARKNNADMVQVGYAFDHLKEEPLDTDARPTGKAWKLLADATQNNVELNQFHDIKDLKDEGVPDAPFKKTWPLLTIKRMVRYAAENGFDAVSWDTGEVQAGRYDLSKQVKELYWNEDADLLEFVDINGKEHTKHNVPKDKLADYVGKEAAEKLIKEETLDPETSQRVHVLRGIDLKVGGEGMKSFYDRLLPNVVNKFFNKKAWGKAKVGTVEVSAQQERIFDFEEWAKEVYERLPEYAEERTEWELKYLENEKQYRTVRYQVHSLPITPEMKEKALGEGMPLFSTTQGLTEKQRVFLERHYPEKLEAFEKEFKRESGGTISKESRDGSKAFVKMGEIPSSPEGFNMPHEGKGGQVFDLLQFKIQDRLNSLRKVQKTIEKQKATEIPDDTNAYQTEELYHGKVARRVGEFDTDHLDPLMDSIHESGLDLEDVEEFLYARHAPEANKRLQDINPKREDNKALSGMSNEESEAIMAKYADNKAMLGIVARVDVVTKKTRQILVDEGLATPEEIAAWENTYKYYVPLKREGKAIGMPKKGKGMDIGGAESKKRLAGSTKLKAVNILTNIIAQHESAIIRAEKAKVGRAMLKLAEAHPNKELWEVDAPELKPFLKQRKSEEIDEITGLPTTLSEVVYGKDILYKFNDNVLVIKVGGKEHTITFNDQNVHAQRMARSLKNLGADNSNAVINTLSAVNRLLAIVNTSANPEFIISNFARDIQTAGYNINDTEAKNVKIKIFKDVFKALQGIRKGIREDYSSEWAKNFKDFAKAGAQTGWTDHYKNIEAREKSLKKKLDLLKDGKWSSAQRAARGLFEFVSNENTAVENAIRLSTYTHLKRIGLSNAKAASAAKNLTVNFNRRGDMGQALNALYLFFNANVQGSARLIYAAVRSPTVRRMMYGTVAFAVMLDILNRAIGGDDDDGEKKYDKIAPWVKEHNLILMRPNGDYFKLPLPWGYNTLHVLGQCIGEAIDPNKDKFDVMLAAAKVGSAVVGSFNPLGSESSLLQLAAPTIADPFVQWAENQNFAGIPIKPEQLPFDVPKPEYQMYWQNSRKPSRWISKKFNDLTSGDEVKPGLVNVSPEVIDLFVDTLSGGAGRFIDNTISLPGTLTKKDIDVRRIPFIRKMYGESPDYYLRTKFYDNLGEIRYAEKSKKHYSDDKERLVDVKRKYAWELRFVNRMKRDKAMIRDLRKKRRTFENQKELSKMAKEKKVEEIEKKVSKIMTDFNRTYKGGKGQKRVVSPLVSKPVVSVTNKPLTLREAMRLK